MLLMEESELWSLYSTEERDEFLFRVMKHIVIGGALCQYEDALEPYMSTCKSLYKELLSYVLLLLLG